eukprot:TRINITY_DN5720_c5_g1_i1.p1 TRINITY_DN5720_c5_g1~~TRINITY_DN5720_c5_g1_i1.p1  ORF type:complete len:582 (+),score=86.73 TRINITY_DN5720_c5_g1_i1:73-1818(+)
MGISGLLPCLKSIEESCNVRSLKGKRVGVDTYCWLHKLCRGSAKELALGEATLTYLVQIVRKVQDLTDAGVEVVMVFDGADMPLKGDTNSDRKLKRLRSLKRAETLHQAGRQHDAKTEYMAALEITTVIAQSLIRVLKHFKIQTIVAPYEADAQLAFLANTKQIDYVITEDSDLLAYLTPQILYKVDRSGNAVLIRSKRLSETTGLNFDRFTKEMVLTNFILAGCDYLPSLHGIGVKKANKLVLEHRDITKILDVLRTDPKQARFGDDFVEYGHRFLKAFFAFKHHIVYDPRDKKVKYSNELPNNGAGIPGICSGWITSVVGTLMSDEMSYKICEACVLDPVTHRPYDPSDPALENSNIYIRKLTIPVQLQQQQQQQQQNTFKHPKKKIHAPMDSAGESPPTPTPPTPTSRVVKTVYFKEDAGPHATPRQRPQNLNDFLSSPVEGEFNSEVEDAPEQIDTEEEVFLKAHKDALCPHGLCSRIHSVFFNCSLKPSARKRPFAPPASGGVSTPDLLCLYSAVRRRTVTSVSPSPTGLARPSQAALQSLMSGGTSRPIAVKKSSATPEALVELTSYRQISGRRE